VGSGAWLDEFIIEATQVETRTKVSVFRKVVQKEIGGTTPIKTQLSNGNIENYVLTQIEDKLKNPDHRAGTRARSVVISTAIYPP
jgi:hypothetical protein